jgi:hypothetical protein
VAQLAGLILLVFGLLPIANWIPGGHAAPWYGNRVMEWGLNSAIVCGIGIVAMIAFRGRPALWRPGLWAGVAARWRRGDRRADAGVAAVVLGVCAVVSRVILSAKPLLIDEIISLYQARIFASGRLTLPAPPHPEFTSAMHLLDWNGKVYGQFPAGGPAMLAIGTLLHAEWLVGPVATAIGAYLFARLLRRLELRDGTALAALLIYGLAPFTVFLGGSMMNHVTTTMWLLAAALALAIATTNDEARPRATFAMGLAFGIAAAIRPMDAAAFAFPAALWLVWRARLGGPHIRALLLSGVGVAIPMALLFYVNAQQTGHPLRFGYIEMWGKSHELGFHQAPWGPAHTPARGVELINLYLLRLQEYFLECPPSLIFATLALALATRLRPFDRWILAASGMLLLGYFAYWADGDYLGPRFMLPLAPWLALWTARLPVVMETRRIAAPIVQGTVVAGVAALLLGLISDLPVQARLYQNGMSSMRLSVEDAAAANGVHDAVVLVRESWGAQMMARMWGFGVSRMDAEHLYRTNDACRMQTAIVATDADNGNGAELQRRLAPFVGDSARLVTFADLPDTTVRFLPGERPTGYCQRRVAEDRVGFALYPPFLLVRDGNIYVHDLHARDSLVLAEHPGMDLWLLTKAPVVGSPFRFEHVSIDSMRREWALDQPGTR